MASAKTLVAIAAAFTEFWDSITLPGITRKVYHPDLGSIQQLPKGTVIFTWDRASFFSVSMPTNNQAALRVLVDAMTTPGDGLALADAIRAAITASPTMNGAVLKVEIDDFDFSNPGNGFEGLSGALTITS